MVIGTFPFGQIVQEVVQTDRAPKHIFVLGVYASAVHACWLNPVGKQVVAALAIASEPYIFWRGEKAESIIQQSAIPSELGELTPARQDFNGPSGIALDNMILNPLGLDRQQVWLCDLVPHSCVNSSQARAIEREYYPAAAQYKLDRPTVPPVPRRLTDENRRNAILSEFTESQANVLVLLGDKPIQWFLSFFDTRWSNLSDFGRDSQLYGKLHPVKLAGKEIMILPLAHPRQIAKLGPSSTVWFEIHRTWQKQSAGKLLST